MASYHINVIWLTKLTQWHGMKFLELFSRIKTIQQDTEWQDSFLSGWNYVVIRLFQTCRNNKKLKCFASLHPSPQTDIALVQTHNKVLIWPLPPTFQSSQPSLSDASQNVEKCPKVANYCFFLRYFYIKIKVF